jgi:hypothetical protein
MMKALSVDLRIFVLAPVATGASHREAAGRAGVSPASLSRRQALARIRVTPVRICVKEIAARET